MGPTKLLLRPLTTEGDEEDEARRSILTLLILWQAWTFLSHTWALWLFERRYNEKLAGHPGIAEALYCIIITATTVGYGTPVSPRRNLTPVASTSSCRTEDPTRFACGDNRGHHATHLSRPCRRHVVRVPKSRFPGGVRVRRQQDAGDVPHRGASAWVDVHKCFVDAASSPITRH